MDLKRQAIPGSAGLPVPRNFHLASAQDKWQPAIQKCVKAVVSIHFSSITPFDTESAYVSEATGFVVDSARGIIMTNRHVLGPGPFSGYAVFDNHEECSVQALYRDPVHDFGFLRYNPALVKYMQVEELKIRPENAQVGTEIRVIGNDAGEKLSILAGVISRIDRNAPDYGEMGYNDFNTEYIQAAASATGGSSGSPVVDVNGDVIALQAGGSTVASTDFFLPLFRGKRALECLQSGTPITRGTIQTIWLLQPFDECRRLGLSAEAETRARETFPQSIGLLVANTTLPEGPAAGKIEEGDCLLSINGQPVATFRDVDAVLDSSVGQNIVVELMRNGEAMKQSIAVQDLFSITPDRFVRVAGAVVHSLSYQIASYFAHPVRGVYIAYSGSYFYPSAVQDDYSGWIIDELDDQPIPDLDTFIRVVTDIPNGKLVVGKFWHVADPHQIVTSIVNVNRQWDGGPQDFELAVRNPETGLWDFTPLGPGRGPEQLTKQTAKFLPVVHADARPEVCALTSSLVKVKMLRPALLEGYTMPDAQTHGFVIDRERGLVLVSRLCVPHYLVDLTVIIAESAILPAKVRFLHPQQGYAIIQYDPKLLDVPLTTVALAKPGGPVLTQGTPLKFVGYDTKGNAYLVDTKVADVSAVNIPVGFGTAPRYRTTNVESIGVDSTVIAELDSGLLADPETGVVRALWMSHLADFNTTTRRDRMYKFGLDASTVEGVVHDFIKGTPVDPRFIDLEASPIKVATARIRKVPERWIAEIEAAEVPKQRHELLCVTRVSSRLRDYVVEGDVILAINKELAVSVSQLTNLDTDVAQLTVIRRGKELQLDVPTAKSSETVTKSLVSWCGMSIHAPHHAVLQLVKRPPSQVYIVSTHPASPAAMYGMAATSFVTHVNGVETPDIETFYTVVNKVKDGEYAKVRVVNFDGFPSALSICTNYHYFPTWRIDFVDGEWHHSQATQAAQGADEKMA